MWLAQPGNLNPFQDLLDIFNGYRELRWKTPGLEESVIFLEFVVDTYGPNNVLKFTSYTKLMNIFLYIPAHSAHPTGAIEGIIYSII